MSTDRRSSVDPLRQESVWVAESFSCLLKVNQEGISTPCLSSSLLHTQRALQG